MLEAMDIKQDFQKTEIGEYPTDWNIKELSVVLKSTQLGGNYPNSVLNAEYVLIKMGNLGRGFIDFKKIFYIKSGTIPQQIDKSNYGDILFNTRNTLDLVGKVAIWKDELPLAFFNSNIMRLVFKDEEISSNFFMNYILNTPESLHQLRGIATGTTSVAAIYTRDLIKIKVPVPTKTEQTAIATVLNDADALITQLEKLVAKKRAIKQGAMQELLKPKAGWEVKKLGEVAHLRGGFAFKSNLFVEIGIPIIRISDVKNDKVNTSESVCYEPFNIPRDFIVHTGDVLIAMSGATTGKIGIYQSEKIAYLNQRVGKFVVKDYLRIDKVYISHLVRSEKFKENLIKEIAQGAQPNISGKQIENLELPILNKKTEQTHIAQILSDMDAEIEALEKKLNKYKMIKQGMMQNLLTGRIRLV